MSLSFALPLTSLFFAALTYALFKAVYARRSIRAFMPPGPPGIPFLGNALQVQESEAFRQFAEWGTTYGPIISLDMAGQPVIVVNSLKIANDLFDRRSAIYSDRPRLIMAFELLLGGQNLGLMPYGHAWRKQRRAVHEAMNVRDVPAYSSSQEREALKLILQLLDSPDDWKRHCNRGIVSSISSIVYGTAVADKSSDELLGQIFEVMHAIAHFAAKKRHMVEIFPSMLLLPDWLAKWKRDAVAFSQRYTAIFGGYYESVGLRMHEAGSEVSFCGHLIRNENHFGLSTREAVWLAAILMLAGVDTSSGMLSAFFLIMLRSPGVMRRVQTEVDTAIGRDRLPTLDDLDELPYTHAVVHELLRWWPVTPLSKNVCRGGLLRYVNRQANVDAIEAHFIQDDWYNGYFIPKGTTVLPNLWAMSRNTEDFPDPDCFRPERFLHENGDGTVSFKSMTQKPFAFGFGRRICPGANVATRNLFIQIACILWAFDIRPSVNGKGEPIVPSDTDCFDDGLVITPLPFSCVISPRSHDIEQIVKSTLQTQS